ncbi:MAG: hypothetical protein HZB91_02975 [Elusimicrobia bacterium]|nr:hypothetical protein [Elusimicrobiota bacterium]
MTRCFCLFLLVSLGNLVPSRAQVDRETVHVLGWSKACSVAVEYFGFPGVGAGLFNEPISMQIGSIALQDPALKASEDWIINAEGKAVWDPDKAAKAVSKLKKTGFVLAGSSETVPAEPTGWPEIDAVLLTTRSLGAYSPSGWPAKDFRLHQIHYSPMGTCALLLYRWTGSKERDFFQFLLVRTRNPRAKIERAMAHLDLAIRLFDRGDLAGALDESGFAARAAPNDAEARYRHAAYLALSGYYEDAFDELSLSLRYEKKNKERARKDPDFEGLAKDKRFKTLTRP